MGNRRLLLRLAALLGVLAVLFIAAVWALQVRESVVIKTGDLSTDSRPQCYTDADSGELVSDPISGTAIIEGSGRRVAVTWPIGWTGRRSGSEVEVLDSHGNVNARTGTHVYLLGGYWLDDSFLTCGAVPGM